MDGSLSPSSNHAIGHDPARRIGSLSEDATSPHRVQQYLINIRRSSSMATMAARLAPPSPIGNMHNSWSSSSADAGYKTQKSGAERTTSTDEQIHRTRRTSISFSNIGRGIFRQKSTGDGVAVEAEEETENNNIHAYSPNSKGRWFQRLTNTFRKERTASMPEMDSTFHSHPFASQYALDSTQSEDMAKRWNYQGGAAARASAAAQNEASYLNFSNYRKDLSQVKEPQNDSESGIWVDLHDNSDTEETGSIMIRLDPASVLPVELFAHCLSFLDASSLTDAELVSKRWHQTSNSRAMWRNIFSSEFGRASPSTRQTSQSGGVGYGKLRPDQQWKKMWKARKALHQRWVDGYAAAIYLEGHTDTVYCVQFDETKIITGSRDCTLRVWDMKTLQCIKVIGKPKPLGEFPENQPLTPITQGHKPFATIVPKRSKVLPQPEQNEPKFAHQGSVLCLQFDAETLITGSSDMTVIVWDIKNGYIPKKCLRSHTAGVLDVCFDDHYIVSCSKDTTICLWNRNSGELVRQLSGHRGPVNAVQLRGDLIVSASGDGIAKLWNISSGLCIKEFSSRDRGLACVEFSPDCRYIYAGGNDQSIYQFDANTKELVREFQGHRNLVRSLHLDPLNQRIVSGSYDHSIQAYNTQTGELMCDFAGWTTSWILSAKMDYRRIVATSQDRRVVIIDFGLGVRDIDLLTGDDCDDTAHKTDWISS